MTESQSYQARTKAIRETYFEQIPETMQKIEDAWQQLKTETEHDNSVKQLQFLTHKLAGASLSLGYTQIGGAARAVETSVRDAAENARLDNPVLLNLLEQYMASLRDAVATEQNTAPPVEPPNAALKAVKSLQDARAAQLIYLVEDDLLQAQELVAQIGYFGYTVQTFTKLADLRDALKHTTPAIILMDIVFHEGDTAGPDTIFDLRETQLNSVPVIFISSRDDLTARLRSLRAGGAAYFTKPVNISRLIDWLDRFLESNEPVPYRVLIVDDMPVQANMAAMQLKRAGMETAIATEPLRVIDAVNEFNPELILLDIYMPECTGMELAKIIRQMENFISIPIVYLSAETDRDKQLLAVSLGGDDFLTKPIKPDYLVSAVKSRVERYRQLRRLMVHDSLTGLLNHTTIKERLGIEIARALRQNTSLAVAMLDLDHFKMVNDTYGHAAGDRVLKSLAHLLSRRLRKNDIVGRYGGEEFSIVLPNTQGEEAQKILDELRANFAEVHHLSGDMEFSVTFSCGIATYPRYTTPGTLSEGADKALYTAKHNGRNRIELAPA